MDETRIELYRILNERFSDSDIRTLCFTLGVEYDDLPGEAKGDKARELILYLERRHQITQILEAAKRLRPDVSWEPVMETFRLSILKALYEPKPFRRHISGISKSTGLDETTVTDQLNILEKDGFVRRIERSNGDLWVIRELGERRVKDASR